MDPNSLQKWKEEFQNERKKQFSKVKGLQKETSMRRKAMEMKAQIEAAKEEKRRKEALAERKAQHMEATMRFQKGIKNFKFQKEKISLEEVLKQISTPRSRLNSADSESRTKLYHNDLANYYCVNNTKKTTSIKRSSSFDSIPKSVHSEFVMSKTQPSSYRLNNFNIDTYNSTTPNLYRPANNNNSNLKQAINENQKQIHEMNREALKEFQNLIKTELGNQSNQPSTSNFIFPIQQKFTNLLPQQELIKKEPEQYSEVGTILTVDDPDERDSMDTDSLLNARIESPDFNKQMLDKKSGQEDDVFIPIKNEASFNNYFRINSPDNVKKNNFICKTESFRPVNKTENNRPLSLPPQPPPALIKPVSQTQTNNFSAKKQTKQIKSILKRSSSLDNNSLLISALNNTAVNFKSEKVIKDSIELANSRMNGNNSDTESGRKKSVRFATFEEEAKIKSLNEKINETPTVVQNNNSNINSLQQQAHTMTSQDNTSNIDFNESNTNQNQNSRISSTNSIRRPIIKPRFTSQIKSKNNIEAQKGIEATIEQRLNINENSKPPLPNTQNGYSMLSQKRKDLYQRNRPLQSPKTNQQKIPLSPSSNQENNSNFIYDDNEEPSRIFRQVIHNFHDIKTKQNTPASTNVQPSQNKFNDNLNREMQINKYKNELNKELNFTEPNQNSDKESMVSRVILNPNNLPQFVQKQYISPQEKQTLNVNGIEQLGIRRPFSGFVPNSKMLQENATIRLAYLNSINQQRQSAFNAIPRVLSADCLNRNQTQAIQLEIKYPLYSNVNNQSSPFLNFTKPNRPVASNEGPQTAKEVLDSMALFLKAEDMSNKNYTESQIMNQVQNGHKPMTSLSIEEAKIKNSLIRLDERYNFLKAQNQGRFDQEELIQSTRFNPNVVYSNLSSFEPNFLPQNDFI